MTSKKWLFGILIIGVAIVALSFLKLGDSLVYFYTPAEAMAKAASISSTDIRVGGLVKPGSLQKNAENLDINFTITDLENHEIAISYKGAPPDMFKESQGVVVEGKIAKDGQSMAAKKLFVKHSEEYKKPDDHSKMNTEYLQKSMFKDQNESTGG